LFIHVIAERRLSLDNFFILTYKCGITREGVWLLQHLEHIHGGNLTRASKKYGLPKENIIDFSANINPLGPSREVVAALVNNLGLISSYPDPDCGELRTELAAYLGVNEDLLLLGNGAAELIYLLVNVTGCRKALIPAPTFCEYGLAVLSQGGEVLEIAMNKEEGFALPTEEIVSHLPGADLLFLCNPNNPTGRLVTRKDIEKILDEAMHHEVTVLVDEAFMDFVQQRELFSVMPLVGQRPNLAVLYSLTKFFGIPGLRLGAITAPGDLIARMKVSKDPWNVNVLAQVAGVAGLRDHEYMKETIRLVQEEKEYLFHALSGFPGLEPLPGAANFILVGVAGSGFSSGELTDLLGRRGIMVRDCAGFTGLTGRYLRLAVKTRLENEKLILAFKDIWGGKTA
jgi:threonine-phosphate decarboxylase